MKKLILFSILSVLLYSAPGHAGKEGKEAEALAAAERREALAAAERREAATLLAEEGALAVTRFLKADAREREAYAQEKRAYVQYREAEKAYRRPDAQAQAKEAYEQAQAEWRKLRSVVWQKADDERSQALLQAREKGVEEEAEREARAAAEAQKSPQVHATQEEAPTRESGTQIASPAARIAALAPAAKSSGAPASSLRKREPRTQEAPDPAK